MAITLQATPMALGWGNFTSVANLVDPADGVTVDAFTRFNFNIPNLAPRTVDGQLALADPMVVTVTPNAQVRNGVTQAAGLLSHEQFHYDVGIVTGRALARELMRLRAADVPALRTALQRAVQLHFFTRAGLLQRRYDLDTRHGTNAHYQGVWKTRMNSVLADPRSEQLGGFWL